MRTLTIPFISLTTKNDSMKQFIMATIFVLLAQITIAQTSQNPDFDKQLKDLLSFTIPTINCDDLNKDIKKVILLDCREKTEYDISHLKGAIYVGYDNFKASSVANLDKDAAIVVYCSVGYRSERIGERLQRMGFKNVKNLYGSIFEWVNSGYPVVNAKGNTTKVHGVDEEWAKWILKGEAFF